MNIQPGKSIAIKVPLHRWQETVAFYRDKVGLMIAKELAKPQARRIGAARGYDRALDLGPGWRCVASKKRMIATGSNSP